MQLATIEALEDRRLLSATLANPAQTAHAMAAHKSLTVFAASHGVTLRLLAGQQFTGNLGYISGAAKRLASGLTLHATVRWGDGAGPSAGVATVDASGNIFVSGTHTYAKAGRFAITVTVTGSPTPTTGAATPTLVVLLGTIHSRAIVSPAASTGGVTLYDTAGVPFTASVGTFITIAPATNLKASITWGDGTSSDGALKAIGVVGIDEIKFEVDGAHTYAGAGTYPIHVVVIQPGPTPTSPDRLIATIDSTAIVSRGTLKLDGTIKGTYTLAPTAADIGAMYIFTGSGMAGDMGPVGAEGRVTLPGFITTGQATGTLTLTSAALTPVAGIPGSVTLTLTGPPEPGFGPFPSMLSYVITGGTGRFAGATGSGTIAVTLDSPAVDNGFTFVITSAPPPAT